MFINLINGITNREEKYITEKYINVCIDANNFQILKLKDLIEYLSWYNEKRIKVKLKGLTPLQFRNQSLKSA